jgi:hypothetical protein
VGSGNLGARCGQECPCSVIRPGFSAITDPLQANRGGCRFIPTHCATPFPLSHFPTH